MAHKDHFLTHVTQNQAASLLISMIHASPAFNEKTFSDGNEASEEEEVDGLLQIVQSEEHRCEEHLVRHDLGRQNAFIANSSSIKTNDHTPDGAISTVHTSIATTAGHMGDYLVFELFIPLALAYHSMVALLSWVVLSLSAGVVDVRRLVHIFVYLVFVLATLGWCSVIVGPYTPSEPCGWGRDQWRPFVPT